jgi:hypothetical protein
MIVRDSFRTFVPDGESRPERGAHHDNNDNAPT